MDHSVWTYIEKLPSEQLESFLRQYYAGEFAEDFSYVAAYIEYELECRKQAHEQS